jgi:hypothetical protein
METLPLLIVVLTGISALAAAGVVRLALLDRDSYWVGPVFGLTVATAVASFATASAPPARAASVVCVLAVVQMWAMRVGSPRTLAHFATKKPSSDGTPGWWPHFERQLARHTGKQG